MSGYIMDLRRIVGHRTLIQCAGSVIIVDAQGRLLLGRRTDNHKWGYSGGSVEIDEKVEDCARRELSEEMGLEAGTLEFFCVNSGAEAHYIYPNGDEVSNFEIVYICRDYRGEPRPQEEEMEALRWFSPAEIDIEEISPPIRPVLRAYLQRFGAGDADGVLLRPFCMKDAEALRELYYPQMETSAIAAMIGEWNQGSFRGRSFAMFAVERAGALVGHISLYEQSPGVVSIGPDVFPPFRRQGVGRSAMRAALATARSRGYAVAMQQVREDNAASIHLHEELGFGTNGSAFVNEKGNRCRIYLLSLR